jgi:outer membrane receptor for ferrienterochelin and colicins
MFRLKNNTGTVVVATLAIVSACPALSRAADDTTPADAAANGTPTGTPNATGGNASTTSTPASNNSAANNSSSEMVSVVVTATRLNEARAGIETQTGASTYTIDSAAIQAIPGGDNTQLSQVVLQAPDVAMDSFGQIHVRGEHDGLQYRLNGIILPEGISVFSQTLDTHLIDTMSLITGALPAEYGLRTAGIIDLTTKSGVIDPYGSVSLYGGSHGEINPSMLAGGSVGNLSYFVTGDFMRNDLGIESPYNTITPIHDETTQYHGFGYFEYILDPDDRLSWILGTSHGEYQIPNTPGLTPTLGLNVAGQTYYPSADEDERQTEITQYAIVSFQHTQGDFNLQTSLSARYTSLTYFPDELGDLLYTGASQSAFKRDDAYSWQTDGDYHLNDEHTIRAGVYVQHDLSYSNTSSQVLPIDPATGLQASDVPITIVDNGTQVQNIESVYLQDEWKLLSDLTVNYGLRFDHLDAYTSGHQLDPRLNIVWKPLDGMTVHGGYSRYFSPPPFELIGGRSIQQFLNTTAQPQVTADSPPLPEKANYYDIGVQQQFTRELTVGVDTYYKQSTNLIDEGQFGAPIILTPFNYRYGVQYGAELTVNYSTGPFNAYANFSTQRARGKDIETAQFNFSANDLEYITNHWIALDHEQEYTGSGGVSYRWNDTLFSSDILLGSGLREDLPVPQGIQLANGATTYDIPNGAHLPYYRQVNMGVSHTFTNLAIGSPKNAVTLRFDVINVFDTAYEIRNGTGVGVGAPQWGPRRGFFGGFTIPF